MVSMEPFEFKIDRCEGCDTKMLPFERNRKEIRVSREIDSEKTTDKKEMGC